MHLKFILALSFSSALVGQAQAQSVLERVLGTIDNATNLTRVNGTYANIAENIGGTMMMPVDQQIPDTREVNPDLTASDVQIGIISTDFGAIELNAAMIGAGEIVDDFKGVTFTIDYDLTVTIVDASRNVDVRNGDSDRVLTNSDSGTASLEIDGASVRFGGGTNYQYASSGGGSQPLIVGTPGSTQTVYVPISVGIDGSINNTVTGVTVATETVVTEVLEALQFSMPTINFGDMATTALGAVNTGDITLGVNSAVDEASTSTTRAISAVMDQIGGSADTGAIVLNVASNMTGVNGSINNTMTAVNGTIGNLSTTALGAVNTGTIVSGVNATVQGIVGISGQSAAGL